MTLSKVYRVGAEWKGNILEIVGDDLIQALPYIVLETKTQIGQRR